MIYQQKFCEICNKHYRVTGMQSFVYNVNSPISVLKTAKMSVPRQKHKVTSRQAIYSKTTLVKPSASWSETFLHKSVTAIYVNYNV